VEEFREKKGWRNEHIGPFCHKFKTTATSQPRPKGALSHYPLTDRRVTSGRLSSHHHTAVISLSTLLPTLSLVTSAAREHFSSITT